MQDETAGLPPGLPRGSTQPWQASRVRPDRPLLARRRALTLILGAAVPPALGGCTHTSGGKAAPGPSSATSRQNADLVRTRLLSAAVAREQALLDLCTSAASGHGAGRVAAAAARDHRAHLTALLSLRTGAGTSTNASPTDSPSATAAGSPSATAAGSPSATRPAARVVADAESAWSADLLALLPAAPSDLRRLLASVAASEASHAALLTVSK